MLQKKDLKIAKSSHPIMLSNIEDLSDIDIQKLKIALVRYECLAGLNVAITPYEKELLSVDRKNFKRYMPKGSLGVGQLVELDSKRCSMFIHEITGCDLDSCNAFLISLKGV